MPPIRYTKYGKSGRRSPRKAKGNRTSIRRFIVPKVVAFSLQQKDAP